MKSLSKKLLLTLSVLIVFSSCGFLGEDKSSKQTFNNSDVKIAVEKFQLSNGLKVLLIKNSKLPIYSYYSYFNVGAINEYEGITGSSHYLEHLLFKGENFFDQGRFDHIIESNGGSSNAYTTNDSTVYYERMPSSSLELMIKVEADRMQKLVLKEKGMKSEREVVLDERKGRYENSPGGELYLSMMKAMFKNTPYGRSVIGSVADIKTVTKEQIQAYFKKHYVPNNAIVVIAGDMNIEKTRALITLAYGDIPTSTELAQEKKEKEDPKLFKFTGKYNREIKLNGTPINPKFMLAYQGVKLGVREAFVMDILSSVLGGGKSSHLHQKYVDGKKPKLRSIGVGNYNLVHSGVFYISGDLLKGVNLNSFEKNLKKELVKSCSSKVITNREVQKVKNGYLVSLYDGLQTNSGVASFIGDHERYYGDYLFYEKELAIYNGIEPDEVIEVCHKVFDVKKSIFSSIWTKHAAVKK